MLKRLSLGLAFALSVFDCAGPPSQIEFVSVTPDHPNVGDIATLVFRLEDYRGIPMAGSNVTFKLTKNTPGVTLSPASAMSDKGSGEVRVQVSSTVTETVQVIADAGGGKVAISPTFTFTGSHTPNARQLTFQCGPFGGMGSGGVHAIGAYDPARHLLDGIELDCYAHVADRNGDIITGASLGFAVEAGTITPNGTTDDHGTATVTHKVTFPLPHPTDPKVFLWNPQQDDTHTGAYLVPLWMEPFTWTANPLSTLLTGTPSFVPTQLNEPQRADPVVRDSAGNHPLNNPRDNLVTMIAYIQGEEGFTDVNGNGKFDDGEPFDDLTEPFIDSNDNGTWDGPSGNCLSYPQYENMCVPDTGEKFIDLNNNGMWDGKNGSWDGNTTIWVMERITWTGIPYGGPLEAHGQIDDYNDSLAPIVHPAQIGYSSPPPPVRVHCYDIVTFTFPISDPWWNSIAQNDDGDGCTAQQGLGAHMVDAAGTFMGRHFDYPPLRDYGFVLADALPRMPAPMTNVPGCFQIGTNGCNETSNCVPYNFSAIVNCKFTATPKAGYHTYISANVAGQISANYP
jgi:hypothetical protein